MLFFFVYVIAGFAFFLCTFWWIVCLGDHCMEFPSISSVILPCWSLLKVLTYSLPRIKWVINQSSISITSISEIQWLFRKDYAYHFRCILGIMFKTGPHCLAFDQKIELSPKRNCTSRFQTLHQEWGFPYSFWKSAISFL